MGGLRKLRRGSDPKYEVQPLRGVSAPRGEKLSAVILDFARPFTDTVDDDGEFKGAIAMAIHCWNVALFPKEEQEREIRRLVNEMAKRGPEFADEIETWTRKLVDRKNTLFASDRRAVVEHTLIEEGDAFHLYVASTPVPR